MSLFGKVGLSHGGVKVRIDAPASVHMTDASIMVTVEIHTDEPHSVKDIMVEVYGEPVAGSSTSAMRKEVSNATYGTPFSMIAGETKSIQIEVPINIGGAIKNALPQNNPLSQVAGVLQKLQSVTEVMDNNQYYYYVQATVDVDGVFNKPNGRQTIQLLKPGEFGGALNVDKMVRSATGHEIQAPQETLSMKSAFEQAQQMMPGAAPPVAPGGRLTPAAQPPTGQPAPSTPPVNPVNEQQTPPSPLPGPQ
ncbi:MAG TPA: hypothetical protein VMU97_01840 [Candidatus Dormibacteraeota bacterium]|nr:hypothetical protein [Candidatus Dormibacteraeota bacterium]